MMDLDVSVDLSTITEEAAETVFAGHDFRRSLPEEGSNLGHRSSSGKDASQVPCRKRKSLDGKEDITAILDIAKAPDSEWLLRTDAGAWYVMFLSKYMTAVLLAYS